MCREKYVLVKNVYKWAKLFKEGQNSIQDKDRPTMVSTPEMVDSVNAPILADRRVTIKDISKQLRIFVGTAHKIVHDDIVFSKVNCRLPHPPYSLDLTQPLISTCLASSNNFCVEQNLQAMMK